MSRQKTFASISALLTCLALVAGCQRDPAPRGSAADAGSSQVSGASARPPDSATETTTDASSSHPRSQGDGGGGDQGNGHEVDQTAVGSPIDVPSIPDRHTSMDGLRPAIEAVFLDACGGQKLCVHIEFGTGACLLGYQPAEKAKRGSTVTVLSETQQECDAANGVTPSSSGETGDESDDTSSDGSGGGSGGVSSSTGASDTSGPG